MIPLRWHIKRRLRGVVRFFSWEATRFFVQGWHDSMYLDYQPKPWSPYSYHYEDGWNMEVLHSIRVGRLSDRERRIEEKNAKYNRKSN